MESLPDPMIHGISLVLGLICGSFVSALSYRLPRAEDFIRGRSRCPHCKADLTMTDLVPLLSWLASRGRCRHCQSPISGRYPALECFCGFLFVAVSITVPIDEPVRMGALWVMAILLLTLSVVDLEHQKLPNSLILCAVGTGLFLTWITDRSLFEAGILCVAVVVAGLLLRIIGYWLAGQPGLGWGDIKLGGALALAIPLDSAPVFLGTSGLLAIILALEFGWRRRLQMVPFGPALCAGAFMALL